MASQQERAVIMPALRKANSIIGIYDVRGWPRPPAYVEALAMLNAARAADISSPLPPAPGKPKDVQQWVDATVDVQQRETARRDVVEQLILTWERNTALAGFAATQDATTRLVTAFDEMVDTLDTLADAPRVLTGHETPEQIESHTAALRVANDLTAALMQRVQIADAEQEAVDIGPNIIWLVLAPHADTTRNEVEDALGEFRQRVPQSLTEWDVLRPLGLRLAHIGEVATRVERHAVFKYQAAMTTPDAGHLDHSYGEIEGDRVRSRSGRVLVSDANMMFDRAIPHGL